MVRLQEELTGALIGLARASEGNEDIVNEATDRLLIEGLFFSITKEKVDCDALKELLERVVAEKKRLVPNCFGCASPCGRTADFEIQQLWQEEKEVRFLKALILVAIQGMAAYAYNAVLLGHTDEEVNKFFYQALVTIGLKDCEKEELLPIVMQTGEMTLKCMDLLNRQ